jgi:hypothetical protein
VVDTRVAEWDNDYRIRARCAASTTVAEWDNDYRIRARCAASTTVAVHCAVLLCSHRAMVVVVVVAKLRAF